MILQVNQQGIETLKLVTKHGKVAEIQEHDVTVVTCMGSPQKEKKKKKKKKKKGLVPNPFEVIFF